MPAASLSVIIPNYNHAAYLPRALDAILAQSFQPCEVLVVDDASTDESLAVIDRYAREHPIVQEIRNPHNLGVVATLNRGASLATGSYLYLAAADDYVLPGFFEKALALLTAHPEAGLCRADDSFRIGDGPIVPNPANWGERVGYLTPDGVCKALTWTIPGHATIVRRDAMFGVGGFRPSLKWYCDWFANVAIAFRHGACHIPEPMAVRVLMPDNYSAAAKAGLEHVAVLGEFLEVVTAPEFADVASLFRRNGAASFFGLDLVRAAAGLANCWSPSILGFLNAFKPEQYEELLLDPAPGVRDLAEFFLGPYGKRWSAERKRDVCELERLRAELASTRKLLPPESAVGKIRWVASKIATTGAVCVK